MGNRKGNVKVERRNACPSPDITGDLNVQFVFYKNPYSFGGLESFSSFLSGEIGGPMHGIASLYIKR
jgi:hypothetical protein